MAVGHGGAAIFERDGVCVMVDGEVGTEAGHFGAAACERDGACTGGSREGLIMRNDGTRVKGYEACIVRKGEQI